MKTLNVIDSHTGGEPTRLVVSGGPDLGNGTLAERLEVFRTRFDDWRAGIGHRAARFGRGGGRAAVRAGPCGLRGRCDLLQ